MSSHLARSGIVTLAVLGLAGCGADTTEPSAPAALVPSTPELAVTSNTWLTRRNMPLDMVYQATAVVPNAAGQSILYVMGGGKTGIPVGAPVPMGEVRAYNVATDSWASKRDMPAVRFEMNAGVINGKIYVPGGFTLRNRPTASLYVYDPASDIWSRKRDMPVPGGAGVTGVIGGKLYVVTFNDLFNYPGGVANFFRYDPAKDSWTKLPSPTDYSRADPGGGGVFNNKLYVIGPRVLVYDPVTNQWTRKGSWGSGLEGRTVVMLSHLYVFGDGIFIYDPVSDTWQKKPLLTNFAWYGGSLGLAAARVFLNGQPRVEVVGGERGWPGSPGNNQQYIP